MCAGVGGIPFLVEASLVAYAQRMAVIATGVGTDELFVAGLGDGAVACDVVVVACEPEAVRVTAYECCHGETLVAACGAAVDDDQIYATHDVTPSAVAIAERILIVV